MTKEEVLLKRKAADDAGVYSDDEIYKAMDEYAKQQAIAYDVWKRINGYTLNYPNNEYVKLNVMGDNATTSLVPVDVVYNLFIESQNK